MCKTDRVCAASPSGIGFWFLRRKWGRRLFTPDGAWTTIFDHALSSKTPYPLGHGGDTSKGITMPCRFAEICRLRFCENRYTRSGDRTHADIRPLELKSNALTTRPSWCWHLQEFIFTVHANKTACKQIAFPHFKLSGSTSGDRTTSDMVLRVCNRTPLPLGHLETHFARFQCMCWITDFRLYVALWLSG